MASYFGDILRKIASTTMSAGPSTPVPGLTLSKDGEHGRGEYKGRPVSVCRPASILNARRLKTIKHPGIVAYVHDETHSGTTWLLTEPVRPLEVDKVAGCPDWAALVAWQAASVLVFLKQASMAHCNISTDAFFIDDCGMFKLGGFDQSVNKRDPGDADRLDKMARLLGCDSKEQLSDRLLSSTDHSRMLSFIKNELRVASRADTLEQLCSDLDAHRLVHLVSKLDRLPVDPEIDRLATVRAASVLMTQASVPRPLVFKVLCSVWTTLSQGGLSLDVVRLLVECICRLMAAEDSVYNKRALEVHSALLKNNDRAVRLFLIESVERLLSGTVDDSHVCGTIYPALTCSLADSAPSIRDAALRSLIAMSGRLPPSLVSSDLLKHFARLQDDPQAGIRTNVLIGLSKLEDRLPEDTRARIIGPAYCRGLTDTFSPAKMAALTGLIQSYAVCGREEIATKLLPAVCPLLVDGDQEIASRATKLVDLFVRAVKGEANSTAPSGPSVPSIDRDAMPGSMARLTISQPTPPPLPADTTGLSAACTTLSPAPSQPNFTRKSRLGVTRSIH